jgi:hypothetical protein
VTRSSKPRRRCNPVHPPLGDRGELAVGGLLLFETTPQDRRVLIMSQLFRPGDQRPVAGDLVVLHRLRGGDDADVHDVLALDLAHQVVAFLDDAVDGRALGALRLLIVQLAASATS